MSAQTIFLIRSPGPLWDGLRATLAALPDARLLGETTSAAEARAQAPGLRPDVLVSGIDVEGISAIPLLTDLRAQLPDAVIVLFTGRYVVEELIGLAAIHAAGYFLWDDLADPAFPAAHEVVRGGAFFVTSQAVGSTFIDAVLGLRPTGGEVQISDRERSVLCHLASGMTRELVARAEAIGVRTLDRVLKGLQTKLDAPTPFVLGMRASQYGLMA